MSTNYMTKSQYNRHVDQIRKVEEKLGEAKMKVGEAAKLGDLSENAEYDAAREEVEFLTLRYEEFTGQLIGMQIVDPKKTDPAMITIGKSVRLKDTVSGEELVYNVVGGGFTDQALNEVSYKAPLAAGLIGSRAGEIVEVPVPDGSRTLEILAIETYE